MTHVSNQRRSQHTPPSWHALRRLVVSLPVFLVLIGILNLVSRATTVPWNNEPKNQSFATTGTSAGTDTEVTFADQDQNSTDVRGKYRVAKHYSWMTVTQPSTGETQRIHMLERVPVGAKGARPAMLFIHGAGSNGTVYNSYADVAHDLASAGFVTMVIDKPLWGTGDLTRDYPASVDAYAKAIKQMRSQSIVDPDHIGLYATSEGTWISAHLLQSDPRIAFQVLLSPMVFTPRHSLGFFVAQDADMVGAHAGYQGMIRRLLSIDFDRFGLHNADFSASPPRAYAVPTFVAYGSRDVMTAQVQGVKRILSMAHESGNQDVTVRSYQGANHVLRMGDESKNNTPLADHLVDDLIDWSVGEVAGLRQTSPRIAGVTIHQSIAVPLDLTAHPTLSWYMVPLHAAAALALLASGAAWVVALARRIHHRIHHLNTSLGFNHGFGWVVLTLAATTLFTLLLFVAGLTEVVVSIARLDWGADPVPPGVIYWSWPIIQIVCTAVVWAWSRVIARMFEVASVRGGVRALRLRLFGGRRSGKESGVVPAKSAASTTRGSLTWGPVIASTRLGRVLFVLTSTTMLLVLLVFAFWGLFMY